MSHAYDNPYQDLLNQKARETERYNRRSHISPGRGFEPIHLHSDGAGTPSTFKSTAQPKDGYRQSPSAGVKITVNDESYDIVDADFPASNKFVSRGRAVYCGRTDSSSLPDNRGCFDRHPYIQEMGFCLRITCIWFNHRQSMLCGMTTLQEKGWLWQNLSKEALPCDDQGLFGIQYLEMISIIRNWFDKMRSWTSTSCLY